jgi:non-ribosomal peptide synthase protein (TIGR01720 family)
LSATEQKLAILNITERLQASFNLSEGSILQVALFNLGEVDFLFITIHHLAVDGVSWRILLEDLQTAYQQLSDRKTISLPPKTTSFKQWSKKLIEYSHSVELQQELPFWLDQLSKQFSRSRRKPRRCTARSLRPLPIDFPGGINTVASSKTVTVALSVEETTILLKQVPAACRTKINDVLLTALVLAFDQWTGNSSLLVDLESHGREAIFDDVDLSRTVGWFTAVFPVWLELSTKELGEALKAVKEQLRRIPNQGIGYGILRYLSQKSQLSCVPQAEVSFNYLGQFDQSFDENSLFALAKESFGSPHSLRGSRSYLLEIDGFVADGQLQVGWTYSEALHQRITIEQLAESFLEKLRSLLCCEAETYTPSDFPLVQLTQEELDAVFEQVEFVGV